MIVSTKKQLNQTLRILSELVAFPVLGRGSNLFIATDTKSVFETNDITYQTPYDSTKKKVTFTSRIGTDVDEYIKISEIQHYLAFLNKLIHCASQLNKTK